MWKFLLGMVVGFVMFPVVLVTSIYIADPMLTGWVRFGSDEWHHMTVRWNKVCVDDQCEVRLQEWLIMPIGIDL